jgi:hypothetical protein
MSFATPNTMIVLTSVGSGWEPWSADLEKNESGWDVLVATYITHRPTATAHQIANAWSIGQSIGGQFWVVKVRPRQLAGGFWLVELTCHGIAAARGPKITGGTATEQQQQKNVATPKGTFDKVTTLESAPTVELEYIALNGAPTYRVGMQGTPGTAVAVRPSVWTTLDDPLYHFPNGWVLMDLPWDRIPNTFVTLYKERWQYIYPFSPGGG